ncbi:MAG: hypothetical protein EBZ24_13395, partial [Synechococcaceae bacterium WB9_4xB_025]|nr:hypothetical protein [Synechococcaceae bacterium WB9_4xB_025]
RGGGSGVVLKPARPGAVSDWTPIGSKLMRGVGLRLAWWPLLAAPVLSQAVVTPLQAQSAPEAAKPAPTAQEPQLSDKEKGLAAEDQRPQSTALAQLWGLPLRLVWLEAVEHWGAHHRCDLRP